MRFEFIIPLLMHCVSQGYITSFHVTKNKIYVTIKKITARVVSDGGYFL